MKCEWKSFKQMLRAVLKDKMLIAVLFAPILAGCFFRFGIPKIEEMLCSRFKQVSIIAPFYGLIDILLAMLTSMLMCYVVAMVVLEERDDKVMRYLCVTPLKQEGYLISRFGFPSAFATAITCFLVPIFSLESKSIQNIILLDLACTLNGLMIGLVIVILSSNKLEGMAVAKLSAILMLGAFVPYFLKTPMKNVLVWLPSYWIGEAEYKGQNGFLFLAILEGIVWCMILVSRFQKKYND